MASTIANSPFVDLEEWGQMNMDQILQKLSDINTELTTQRRSLEEKLHKLSDDIEENSTELAKIDRVVHDIHTLKVWAYGDANANNAGAHTRIMLIDSRVTNLETREKERDKARENWNLAAIVPAILALLSFIGSVVMHFVDKSSK